MGRRQTRTSEDILQYGRDYYYKHKAERAHEYSLVSNRSRLRKKLRELAASEDPRRKLKALGDTMPEETKKIQERIDAITKELDSIRTARWEQKRANGKALFKKFHSDTINETPVAIQ